MDRFKGKHLWPGEQDSSYGEELIKGIKQSKEEEKLTTPVQEVAALEQGAHKNL